MSVSARRCFALIAPLLNVCHPPGEHHSSSLVDPGLPHPAPCARVLPRHFDALLLDRACSASFIRASPTGFKEQGGYTSFPRRLPAVPFPARPFARRLTTTDFSASSRRVGIHSSPVRPVFPPGVRRVSEEVASLGLNRPKSPLTAPCVAALSSPGQPPTLHRLATLRTACAPTPWVSPDRLGTPVAAFQPHRPNRLVRPEGASEGDPARMRSLRVILRRESLRCATTSRTTTLRRGSSLGRPVYHPRVSSRLIRRKHHSSKHPEVRREAGIYADQLAASCSRTVRLVCCLRCRYEPALPVAAHPSSYHPKATGAPDRSRTLRAEHQARHSNACSR